MRRCWMAAGLAMGCLGWTAADVAQAKVYGQCTYQDSPVALVDGIAWLDPAEPDEAQPDPDAGSDPEAEPAPPPTRPLRLAFANFTLDPGAVARSEDREAAFRDQSFTRDGAARFELTVQDDVATQQYLWISPGTNVSYASNELGRYTPGAALERRVVGRYRFTPGDGQEVDCDIEFDLPLLGEVKDAPPPPGVALPADGGATGAAYLAMNRALHAGDIEAMLKMMPAEKAAELRKARSSPDFAAQIAFAQAISPTDVHITGGRQDGDRAWLNFTAKEDGQARLGEVEMQREDGLWVMLKESTRDAK